MKNLYYTTTARVEALKDINRQIDKLMNLPLNVLGGYSETRAICDNLNMLADVIFDEIKADYKDVDPDIRYAR